MTIGGQQHLSSQDVICLPAIVVGNIFSAAGEVCFGLVFRDDLIYTKQERCLRAEF